MKREKPNYEECLFFNRLKIEPDPNPCGGGKLQKHHVIYKREKGNGIMVINGEKYSNLVFVCPDHHLFINQNEGEWIKREKELT